MLLLTKVKARLQQQLQLAALISRLWIFRAYEAQED